VHSIPVGWNNVCHLLSLIQLAESSECSGRVRRGKRDQVSNKAHSTFPPLLPPSLVVVSTYSKTMRVSFGRSYWPLTVDLTALPSFSNKPVVTNYSDIHTSGFTRQGIRRDSYHSWYLARPSYICPLYVSFAFRRSPCWLVSHQI